LDFNQFWSRNSIILILLGAFGALVGLFAFGAGLSYADKPQFCGSCHSMQHVYTTWQNSSHRQLSCGDCHLPQDNIIYKFYVKGENGMRHTYHETVRDYPNTIAFTETANKIANKNCLRCHAYTVKNTTLSHGDDDCTRCHRSFPHGRGSIEGGIGVE
jgi:cytochrome c nitrite reductase small subunit